MGTKDARHNANGIADDLLGGHKPINSLTQLETWHSASAGTDIDPQLFKHVTGGAEHETLPWAYQHEYATSNCDIAHLMPQHDMSRPSVDDLLTDSTDSGYAKLQSTDAVEAWLADGIIAPESKVSRHGPSPSTPWTPWSIGVRHRRPITDSFTSSWIAPPSVKLLATELNILDTVVPTSDDAHVAKRQKHVAATTPMSGRVASQKARTACELCTATFSRPSDLKRHFECQHDMGPYYRCAYPGCIRGETSQRRRDKFREHLRHEHPHANTELYLRLSEHAAYNTGKLVDRTPDPKTNLPPDFTTAQSHLENAPITPVKGMQRTSALRESNRPVSQTGAAESTFAEWLLNPQPQPPRVAAALSLFESLAGTFDAARNSHRIAPEQDFVIDINRIGRYRSDSTTLESRLDERHRTNLFISRSKSAPGHSNDNVPYDGDRPPHNSNDDSRQTFWGSASRSTHAGWIVTPRMPPVIDPSGDGSGLGDEGPVGSPRPPSDRYRFPCIMHHRGQPELDPSPWCQSKCEKYVSKLEPHHASHRMYYCTDCFRMFASKEERKSEDHRRTCQVMCVKVDCPHAGFRPAPCNHNGTHCNFQDDIWRQLFRQYRPGETIPPLIPCLARDCSNLTPTPITRRRDSPSQRQAPPRGAVHVTPLRSQQYQQRHVPSEPSTHDLTRSEGLRLLAMSLWQCMNGAMTPSPITRSNYDILVLREHGQHPVPEVEARIALLKSFCSNAWSWLHVPRSRTYQMSVDLGAWAQLHLRMPANGMMTSPTQGSITPMRTSSNVAQQDQIRQSDDTVNQFGTTAQQYVQNFRSPINAQAVSSPMTALQVSTDIDISLRAEQQSDIIYRPEPSQSAAMVDRPFDFGQVTHDTNDESMNDQAFGSQSGNSWQHIDPGTGTSNSLHWSYGLSTGEWTGDSGYGPSNTGSTWQPSGIDPRRHGAPIQTDQIPSFQPPNPDTDGIAPFLGGWGAGNAAPGSYYGHT